MRSRSVPGGLVAALAIASMIMVSGCAAPAPAPAPAVQRTTSPPWDIPADGVAYIAAAGMEPQPLDLVTNQHVVDLSISIDGQSVPLAAQIGVDKARAVQAPVHTHDASGQVWIEGRNVDQVTLGQFFTVWGVRFTDSCLGAVCGAVLVTSQPYGDNPRPTAVRLDRVNSLAVTVVSKPPATPTGR